MMRKLSFVIGLLFFVIFPLVSATQENPAKEEAKEEREIEFHFEKARYDYKSKTYTFSKGELTDVKEKARLVADEIIYNEETDQATATGNIKFVDEENEITASSINVDLKEKMAVLEGGVTIVNVRKPKEEKTGAEKPKEEEKGLKRYWKDKTTLKCEKLRYNYKEKIAYLEDKVVVTQEDKELTAKKVTWLEKEDKIILEGDVTLKDDKGQTMHCSKMVVCTKEDNEWIDIEGPLSGLFKVKEKKESSSQ
ncbi:hypothetical protein H5T87_02835 [bacterium]|nr:hypothetical protein [bacterium]